MATVRAWWACAAACLLIGASATESAAVDAELSLPEAVRQALDSNLDLASERRSLAADREDIAIARSKLLPQIGVGARVQHLNDDRADDHRGATSQDSAAIKAGINQVLYDEGAWAGYDIQKHVYAAQERQFEGFRLGVILDAASAFLAADQALAVLDVQERNRELTRRNLEISQQRVHAGWSGEREVLRWQSQLAANARTVSSARATALVSRFELNRVRSRPPEEAVSLEEVSAAEYGFVYARKAIQTAIADPAGDERLRNALVRVGLERSPTLEALDEAIAAGERRLTASRRAFWVPSLSFDADIDHLASRSSGSDVEDTEWTVGASLAFPLVQGGAKFAVHRQTREALAGLRLDRRSEAQALEEAIRTAFAQASSSYAELGFAREQLSTARRYFDITNESYKAGVATVLDLLDGQSQLLNAQLSVTSALYGFLGDLISAERQLAFFPFLEPEAEVEELLDRIEGQLQP